jgi:hypothetical protein
MSNHPSLTLWDQGKIKAENKRQEEAAILIRYFYKKPSTKKNLISMWAIKETLLKLRATKKCTINLIKIILI